MLISLQILIKSFASNIIIDLSYSLSINSINTFENCLNWVVYINTLYHLVSLGRVAQILRILQPFILTTGNESIKPCIVLAVWWSVKQIFAPNSPIFRVRLAESQAIEKRLRFTQTNRNRKLTQSQKPKEFRLNLYLMVPYFSETANKMLMKKYYILISTPQCLLLKKAFALFYVVSLIDSLHDLKITFLKVHIPVGAF